MPQFTATINTSFGSVSVSGETETEILGALEALRSLKSNAEDGPMKSKQQIAPQASRIRSPHGKAETSIIKRELERLFDANYFGKMTRSTADVLKELKAITKIEFQSRKVSQALGDFYRTNRLLRVGSRGKFQYLLQSGSR